MTQKNYSIGELAKMAGVNVETIRFYQRRHLLRQPPKPLNGIRHYTERDAQRIRFIKHGQRLGFTLDEVAELLSLEDGQHCQETKEIAKRKLASIRERIDRLRLIEAALSDLSKDCEGNSNSVCPFIADLLKPS